MSCRRNGSRPPTQGPTFILSGVSISEQMSEKCGNKNASDEDSVNAINTGDRARTVNHCRGIREGDRWSVQRRVGTVHVRGDSRTRGSGVVAFHSDGFEEGVEMAYTSVNFW